MEEAGQQEPAGDEQVQDAASQALSAARSLVGVAVRSMAVALEELTLPQYRVLVLLSVRGPLRSGVLAEELGIHPSTFSRLADRLVAGGWVRRLENPESRREVLVDLDGPGRALVAQVTDRRTAEITRILRRVDPAQVPAVLEGFRVFAEAAGESDPSEISRLGMES
jgi:DNA-binding MarR family transcriptional regulator